MLNSYISRSFSSQRLKGFILALFALLVGALYYGVYRQHPLFQSIPGLTELAYAIGQLYPIGYKLLWLPSFLHSFATLLCLHCLLTQSSLVLRIGYRLLALGYLLGFEVFLGYLDVADILAIFAGIGLAECVVWALRIDSKRTNKLENAHSFFNVSSARIRIFLVGSLSGLLAMGSAYDGSRYTDCATYDGTYCVEFKRPAVPVYMSYQHLRQAVQVEAARPPDRLGRVYLYQDYVFLNEVNEGIHVIDNRDPTAPVNLGFIRVPGNTDISIRDNFLYADSYVDLITLDISSPTAVQIVGRQENIFPYDAFQNIPNNIDLSSYDIDATRGVIISYQLSGG